ncbi:GNAT family N-acetyltransferase [Paraburkholderia silviterrae]|uniref:GNAT family N-acetyltransferase n=1 Tax=Paraburkholderia silviterrae TaxID=2528715 RepID=A0A4R5M1T2_9BURK|nr:GNAT family N-acetyltransferase [Paraburkholderia silviterrae]TDG19347.1 GNAT family N-acetyltransferase [Paraburkholderia silviterrae]
MMGAIEILPGASDWTDAPVLMDVGKHVWIDKKGQPVILRPIRPDDVDLARDFVAGLSRRTGYMRMMSTRCPSPAELQRWANLDRQYQGAVVATASVEGHLRQIGVARYAMEPAAEEAEFAIVIADAWQRVGLGGALLTSLLDLARASGVKRMFGTTLSENHAMVTLARRLGFKIAFEPGAAAYTRISVDIHTPD